MQREVADPAQYVELWLRDAGHDRSPDYTRRYDAWAGWFADQGITVETRGKVVWARLAAGPAMGR